MSTALQRKGRELSEVKRKTVTALARKLYYQFPFETKPVWKFGFVNSNFGHTRIISEWEGPSEFNAETMYDESDLPKVWSAEKRKVFHLVHQLYGQMVSDRCMAYSIFMKGGSSANLLSCV